MFKHSGKYLASVVILFCLTGKSFSQQNEITAKQNQLSSVKDEITSLENKLKNKTKKEKESYSVIENYSKQSFLLNKIIRNYRNEENKKDIEINNNNSKIKQLEENINTIQKNFAKYVVAVYKHGQPDDLEMIINSASVQQALLRFKYMEKFSSQRKKDIAELKDNKEQLIVAKEILKKEKAEKEKLAANKEEEQKVLRQKLTERKIILNKIKHDKRELKNDIEAKKQAEVKIKNMITQLIAEAEQRKKEQGERLAREKLKGDVKPSNLSADIKSENPAEATAYDVNLSTSGFDSFAGLKGKLNWPVMHGKIVKSYGENKNRKTNTVMVNNGVDIAASKDLNVKAVSDGVISAIDWIPGYGSVIIVTHKDDYRTVYSHLSEIYVNEGDKVKPGNVIGKVGDSIEGKVLHFEIWSSRKNQNPELWLGKK
jgi:murein hydrolase activator